VSLCWPVTGAHRRRAQAVVWARSPGPDGGPEALHPRQCL